MRRAQVAIPQRLTMRCSERLRLSRCVLSPTHALPSLGVLLALHGWARSAPASAVAELGVVRRRYARCVQRSLFPSLSLLHVAHFLSRRCSTQRESVPGASSPFAARSPFVSRFITHRCFPGVARRSCAQVTATGGSLPVPSQHFGRQFAMLSTQAATPNHALQRTAPRVTVAAISSLDPSRPSVALSYARCLFLRSTSQLPRRAPQSLSLGSLGVISRFSMFDWFFIYD